MILGRFMIEVDIDEIELICTFLNLYEKHGDFNGDYPSDEDHYRKLIIELDGPNFLGLWDWV